MPNPNRSAYALAAGAASYRYGRRLPLQAPLYLGALQVGAGPKRDR
jgi:hypothetical protein